MIQTERHRIKNVIFINFPEFAINASINSSGAHPPPPPRATVGHLLTLSVPEVGHSQFYRGPGGWALAYPGATPGHLTHVFSKDR